MAELPNLDFKSKEEFQEVCLYLSRRMHYLNRVAMGESGFAWTTAEVIAEVGRAFADHHDDEEVEAAFGDGWRPGTLDRTDRVAALFALAFPEAPGR